MKRMLINATQEEELRVAIVDGQYLDNLDIESTTKYSNKANIYKGKISRIEPSLEAAFVDYGMERHGFLPLKEIAVNLAQQELDPNQRINIKDVVKEGQEIIVQVEKEERGNKGAALTTYISLAGCYLVLMPNNPRAGGISRRINREERGELKELLQNLTAPEDMGVIIRTAGVGRSQEELQWDLDSLLTLWKAIQEANASRPAPFLIHQESDIIIRNIRDHLRDDVGEILIDDLKVYEKTRDYIANIRPQFANKIKHYGETIPLFNRYQIERQIESAFQHEVQLPSGGSIVIDHTEALISIDINSARATKGDDIEATALTTNLEAAAEIARQLRIRDLGGLIVIDFIDMTPIRNQREVENCLRDAVHKDRARVQIGRISRFGLLEMSRQRLRPSLSEGSQLVCPRCEGHGTIRGVESLTLSVLRLITEEAMKERGSQIRVYLPLAMATFLMNEKREDMSKIERSYDVKLIAIPSADLETPHYKIERIKSQDIGHQKEVASYEIEISEETLAAEPLISAEMLVEKPAVSTLNLSAPAPAPSAATSSIAKTQPAKPGLFTRLANFLFGKGEESTQKKTSYQHRRPRSNNNQGNNNTRNNRSRHNNQQRRNSGNPRYQGQRRHYNQNQQESFDNRAEHGNASSSAHGESTSRTEGSRSEQSNSNYSGYYRSGNRGNNANNRAETRTDNKPEHKVEN